MNHYEPSPDEFFSFLVSIKAIDQAEADQAQRRAAGVAECPEPQAMIPDTAHIPDDELEAQKKRDIRNEALNGSIMKIYMQPGMDINDIPLDEIYSYARGFRQTESQLFDMTIELRKVVAEIHREKRSLEIELSFARRERLFFVAMSFLLLVCVIIAIRHGNGY